MSRVSIITPLFNKAAYVARTIASVQDQTVNDWELIVVDNGSTDQGLDIVQTLAGSDPRIIVVSYCDSQGPGAARNHGLRQAKGEWVLFLDADDLIEPGHLACLLAEADAHPGVPLIAGHWREFSGDSPDGAELRNPSCLGKSPEQLRDSCIAFAPWAVHAVLVNRSVLGREFWWPEELDRMLAEDTHFWFRLVMENTVHYSKNRGALYRVHTADRRNQIGDIGLWYRGNDAAVAANIRFLEQHGRHPTAGQCESLMRLYSELYWQARCQRQAAIAGEARQKAEQWLRASRELGGANSWTLRMRRILGLKLYLAIRYGLLGKPPHWRKIA